MAELGWSRADLIRVTGESQSTISQWLGKGGRPIKEIGRVRSAVLLANASGFDPIWLAHGEGEAKAKPPAPAAFVGAQEPAAIYGPASDDSTLEQLADLIARIPAANRRAAAAELAEWVKSGEGSPATILALLEGAARRRPGNGPR